MNRKRIGSVVAGAALVAQAVLAVQVAFAQAAPGGLAPHEHAKEARPAEATAGLDLRWQREPSTSCTTSEKVVTLGSKEVVRTVGLEFAEVRAQPLARTVERNAELAYNATRYARLSSRASGVVVEVVKDLGEAVKKGEVLAIVESPDLGAAKSDLLQAIATVGLWEANEARERALLARGVGLEREALEAGTKAAEARIAANRARQRLRTLGLTSEQIVAAQKGEDAASMLSLVAPFDGTIVERAVVIGEVVEPGRLVVAVADTGTMWAMVDLAEEDLAVVQTGQEAAVTVDGLPGRTFAGRLTWISTQVDPRTRTIKARVHLDNGQGLLRANMFGRARISAGESRSAMTVPKEAVQWEGCCNIAFVRADAESTTFRPARLVLGFDAGDRYEVVSGLKAGDAVVTRGSQVLKNEILKDSVGAGCCEVDHLKK